MFDPKLNEFPYPEYTDSHYLVVKKNRGIVFDTNYPYIDKSFKHKLWRGFVRFVCLIIVFPMTRMLLNLKIVGKKNLKKHKKEIKNGVISVCNHVHMWDYLGISLAIKPNKPHTLVWDKNVNGESGRLVRAVGGIPIPTDNPRASVIMYKTVANYLDDGGWLHINAEGSMWEYYAPIRPFKEGAAYFAVKTNKPIIPMAYSFRENKGLAKVFRKRPSFTLTIGEPIYPNNALTKDEGILDLTQKCHEAVCLLAGYKPGENIYEPIYNNSKRIDYYTTTYGIGYKGQH